MQRSWFHIVKVVSADVIVQLFISNWSIIVKGSNMLHCTWGEKMRPKTAIILAYVTKEKQITEYLTDSIGHSTKNIVHQLSSSCLNIACLIRKIWAYITEIPTHLSKNRDQIEQRFSSTCLIVFVSNYNYKKML